MGLWRKVGKGEGAGMWEPRDRGRAGGRSPPSRVFGVQHAPPRPQRLLPSEALDTSYNPLGTSSSISLALSPEVRRGHCLLRKERLRPPPRAG